MPVPPIRAKQTSNTTGTGTLTLNAAPSDFRSYNAAFGGSSQRVRYALSRAGAWGVGYGVFNGGSPGTRTRVSVKGMRKELSRLNAVMVTLMQRERP